MSNAAAPLRADAERNRQAILVAARQVFRETGSAASMKEIARRANVGIATLFRRFPTREHLLAAAFTETLGYFIDAIERGLDDDDAWRGFRQFLEAAFELQAHDSAFKKCSR